MKPLLSQTRWILVPNPPRERPSAWSGGSCICTCFGPPNRLAPGVFFSRAGGSPAGADDGAIDTPQVVVDLAFLIQFVQQRGDDAGPSAVLAPAGEAMVDGFPRAVTFREVTPGGTGIQNPEDPVDDRTRVVERVTGLTP